MENSFNNNTPSVQTANQVGIYKLITLGVLLTVFGAFIRYAYDSRILSIIAWIILFIGVVICIKAVFKILAA